MDSIQESLVLYDDFLTKELVQEMMFYATPQSEEIAFPTVAPTVLRVERKEDGLFIPLSRSTQDTLETDKYNVDDKKLYIHENQVGTLLRIKLRVTSSREVNSPFKSISQRILEKYSDNRETSIVNGITFQREYPGYLLRVNPGLISYQGIIYSCADMVMDLREELALVPPRGVGVLVLYIDKGSIDNAGKEKIISDIKEVFLPVSEGGDIDPILSQAHGLMEENAVDDYPFLEVGKIQIIDNLLFPPTFKVSYDETIRVDSLANWQI